MHHEGILLGKFEAVFLELGVLVEVQDSRKNLQCFQALPDCSDEYACVVVQGCERVWRAADCILTVGLEVDLDRAHVERRDEALSAFGPHPNVHFSFVWQVGEVTPRYHVDGGVQLAHQ